jgi:hypothetical protein
MVNLKKHGRKMSWSIPSHYSRICLGEVKKGVKDLSVDSVFLDRDSKAGLQENKITSSVSRWAYIVTFCDS